MKHFKIEEYDHKNASYMPNVPRKAYLRLCCGELSYGFYAYVLFNTPTTRVIVWRCKHCRTTEPVVLGGGFIQHAMIPTIKKC